MMDLVAAGLDELHERISGRFARAEPRARVREYVSGLVTGLERKNGWTLAEWAGEVSPDGMQRLLRRADWDVDGVRDDVRAYVIEQLYVRGVNRFIRGNGPLPLITLRPWKQSAAGSGGDESGRAPRITTRWEPGWLWCCVWILFCSRRVVARAR
jgi:hypothetical protein